MRKNLHKIHFLIFLITYISLFNPALALSYPPFDKISCTPTLKFVDENHVVSYSTFPIEIELSESYDSAWDLRVYEITENPTDKVLQEEKKIISKNIFGSIMDPDVLAMANFVFEVPQKNIFSYRHFELFKTGDEATSTYLIQVFSKVNDKVESLGNLFVFGWGSGKCE